jgi:PAS domain S-box-containing protein
MNSQKKSVPNDAKRTRARAKRTIRSSRSSYSKAKKIDLNLIELGTETTGGLDARFREVMDAAPVMIWVSGKDKGCVWFNKPWLTFTGRRLAQEVGKGWSEGVHHDDFDRCLKIYSTHFDAHKDFRMQYRLRRHDGAYRWIDDTGIPRFAHNGGFLGYIGSCVDVQDHREAQSELRSRLLEIAELNRRTYAAMLVGSIVQDINQPLAAMVSNGNAGLRWLAKDTPDVQRARITLKHIVGAGLRAGEIVDSIRAISEEESYLRAPLNLNDIVREVLVLVENELEDHHIAVRSTLNEMIPKVLADRVQLQHVILNLIKNAIEAMGSTVDGHRLLHIEVEFDGSQNIILTVQDSGAGIDPENVERIFDRFFTTKTNGKGMGLTICRSIIEAHNGRLWAEPGIHQGSLFRISLPIGPK